MIRGKIEEGTLQPGMTLIDASSGTWLARLPSTESSWDTLPTVVANSKLTADKRKFIEYYGAELQVIGDFTIDGNRYCQEKVQREEPGRYFFLTSFITGQPQAHYETTGPEILADFPDVAMVVGSLGSGGAMAGTARFLKKKTSHEGRRSSISIGHEVTGHGKFR